MNANPYQGKKQLQNENRAELNCCNLKYFHGVAGPTLPASAQKKGIIARNEAGFILCYFSVVGQFEIPDLALACGLSVLRFGARPS